MADIIATTKYKTTDGKSFNERVDAVAHQQKIDVAEILGADGVAKLAEAGYVVERARKPRAAKAEEAKE